MSEKSNMTIEVEFLAGTALPQAIKEAKAKAKLFNVAYVQFKFNGVNFSIGRNAVLNDVLEKWDAGGSRFIIAA